ncbi:type III pantothenate kinase [Pasteuria penetrans]|uniref:type III pantothenate kinase n=1 Tax=Pasteuria penetrans TaxID=86005 RepID=UPI000FA2A57D|nr:type III pantothenate kinase [Pasteuria penetrans]
MIRRLLAVDIGNTNVTVGFYECDQLRHSWRFRTRDGMTEDELAVMFSSFMCLAQEGSWQSLQGVIISCVVPELQCVLRRFGEKYLDQPPLFVETGLRTGLTFVYPQPESIGADRIANAVAAHTIYGSPVIVVDFGTATTFTLVAQEGRFLGGLIAPGVRAMVEALFQRVPHLPRVEIAKPKDIIGGDTPQSIQAGIYYGILGLLEGTLCHIRNRFGGSSQVRVVATGGFSGLWAKQSVQVDVVDDHLTLHGLRILYEYNT